MPSGFALGCDTRKFGVFSLVLRMSFKPITEIVFSLRKTLNRNGEKRCKMRKIDDLVPFFAFFCINSMF